MRYKLKPGFDVPGRLAKSAPAQRGKQRSRNETRDFLASIDEQIALAREDIKRAQHKVAVLEELRRGYSAKPYGYSGDKGDRLPPTQHLATQAIASYLKNRTEPVRTTALLHFLDAQGIRFGGRYPRNTLSVLLSRSQQFVAHGRRGWTMARDRNKQSVARTKQP
jgi:hypothetical protein